MIEIKDYKIVKTIFENCGQELIVNLIENGKMNARVWIDNDENATFAIVLCDSIMKIIGSPESMQSQKDFERFFQEVVCGKIEGIENNVNLTYFDQKWEKVINPLLKNLDVWKNSQSCFSLNINNSSIKKNQNLFEIKEIHTIDEEEEKLEILNEEVASLSLNQIDYLNQEFGFYALKDDELLGYFLSMKSSQDTTNLHFVLFEQSDDLTSSLLTEFCQEAIRRGYKEIIYECNSYNASNIALMKGLGFEKVKEEEFLYIEY